MSYARVLSPEEAYRRICQSFDIYFLPSLVESAVKGSNPFNRMNVYIGRVRLGQFNNKTYGDTIAEEMEEVERLKAIAEDEARKVKSLSEITGDVVEGDDKQLVNPESYKFWGFGFKPEEYEFLDNKYVEWTSSHECNSKAQESVFQKICMVELSILKANQEGEKITDLMKQFNDLLKTGNLQPKQNSADAFVETNTLGTLIKKWETDDPIPEPDDKWRDVDGIKKYFSVWFLGHLCKMLGIDNKYSREWKNLYENEVAKFTVTPSVYEDDDTGGYSFDDVFG
jgi:hypothetical protein